jgi:methionyl-tRNA formyltransferase
MKIALIMNDNSYAGREYLHKLGLSKVKLDIITIGTYPKVNRSEDIRTGGLWNPMEFEDILKNFEYDFKNFPSLKSKELLNYLKSQNYDIGIQGGTGILTDQIISEFKNGILNFHPGDLPKYRGCSAPEWQIFEGSKIYSTCHFIDSGIDTGEILTKKALITQRESYESFRSSIYPQTALFVTEVITAILLDKNILKRRQKQNEKDANYRSYIGDDKIIFLRNNFFEQR